jgi:hypothetical protein
MKKFVLSICLLGVMLFYAQTAEALYFNLISVERLPSKAWKYVIDFDMSRLSGDAGNPVFMGAVTGWQRLPMTEVNSGFLRVEVITYNTESSVVVAGNESTGSWFNGRDTGFWDDVAEWMVFGFHEGQIYQKGFMPQDTFPPGTQGDGLVRYKEEGTTVSAYAKLAPGSQIDSPFISANLVGGSMRPAVVVDSFGWVETVFTDLTIPCHLEFGVGGHWDDDPDKISWLDLSSSMFFNSSSNRASIHIGGIAGEPIQLVSAVQLPDFSWKYFLKISRNPFYGDKSLPVFMGDVNDWQRFALTTDAQGWLLAEIVSFNQLSRLSIAGNETLGSWYDGTQSDFWVGGSVKSLMIGFSNGQLLKQDQFVPNPVPPGTIGDDWLRYKVDGSNLTIYINLVKHNRIKSRPFVKSSVNNWEPVSLSLIDASGWASCTYTNVTFPLNMLLIGGGYQDDLSENVISMAFQGSSFYSRVRNCEYLIIGDVFSLVNVVDLTDGQKQYVFTVDPVVVPGVGQTSPTLAADFDNWQPVEMTVLPNGLYQAVVTTKLTEFRIAVGRNAFTVNPVEYFDVMTDGRVICEQPKYVKSPFGISDVFSQWLISKELMVADISIVNNALSAGIIDLEGWSFNGAVVIGNDGWVCQ